MPVEVRVRPRVSVERFQRKIVSTSDITHSLAYQYAWPMMPPDVCVPGQLVTSIT